MKKLLIAVAVFVTAALAWRSDATVQVITSIDSLLGVDLVSMQNGATIVNGHADTLSITEANTKLVGKSWLMGDVNLTNGTVISNPHADTFKVTEANISLVGITLFGGKFKSGSVVFDSASHGVARDTLLFWAHDTAYALVKRP